MDASNSKKYIPPHKNLTQFPPNELKYKVYDALGNEEKIKVIDYTKEIEDCKRAAEMRKNFWKKKQ